VDVSGGLLPGEIIVDSFAGGGGMIHPVPKPDPRPPSPRTGLQRKSRLVATSAPTRKTPVKKMNPERIAKRGKRYASTLRKAAWRGMRTAVLLRAGFRCESCGYEPEHWTVGSQVKCPELHVHHAQGYSRFGGAESIDELRCLCQPCHAKEHGRAVIRPRQFRRTGTEGR
jgi:5-methylcytosine-specific restriction endonuclease McrA